nr:immunoglobulin heavy chain junction region [Mus musculus]MBK4185815.1 immunoglobulin heavy chain junction region [Mus musculus]MBK4185816.1 immunoglobulin heavy chain junction region [Mus musculus]
CAREEPNYAAYW